ncbi:uncharacterized protein BDZ99DRAFT_39367 [Mytilinidion resinicola]|uniref:Uncharacterized protein n=1 Tax=Mytilinidion resinicola TaxID=574789 RepID=A0A6A6YJR7_9PEZI|nr:uncharacterized protein BDZ99DRAFT_39367 [Mytilinidion resinicola]KAF2808773.1 hypothetical protein BDZ99DRAFT_39367 [Mytilinidion resinicola]
MPSLLFNVLLFAVTASAFPLSPDAPSPFITDISKRSCASFSYATRITCAHHSTSLKTAREAIATACEAVSGCTPGKSPYPFGAGVAGNATAGGSVTAMVNIGEQCIDGVTVLSPKRCRNDFESFVSAQCGDGRLGDDKFACERFFKCGPFSSDADSVLNSGNSVFPVRRKRVINRPNYGHAGLI